MLDSPIAMLKFPLVFALVFWMQTAGISITSPQPGDTLRGQVEINGSMDSPNFASAELGFSYAIPAGNASDPAVAWFTIQTFPQPVQNPILAIWDTTAITDGDYILRLRVFFQDGTSQDVIVPDLKIRNDEPLATVTATPTETVEAFAATEPDAATPRPPEPTLQSFPTSTPLPPNPAAITNSSIFTTFGRGVLAALVIFIFASLLFRLRKIT